MAITTDQILSATTGTRQITEAQRKRLSPLAETIAQWERMGFTTQSDDYRRDCRVTAAAWCLEVLAQGLLAGKVGQAVEEEIAKRIDPRDEPKFRRVFAGIIQSAIEVG